MSLRIPLKEIVSSVSYNIAWHSHLKASISDHAEFWLSREELSSKPATALTALFASLDLPIELVPRAIRRARERQED